MFSFNFFPSFLDKCLVFNLIFNIDFYFILPRTQSMSSWMKQAVTTLLRISIVEGFYLILSKYDAAR